jgi:hypothetical protein
MTVADRDPILNIQPVDPFNPKPTIVKLRFDEPKQFEGKYGTQFMYSVEDERGVQHVLFASQALDGQIHQVGAKANDRVAIVRTGQGKDTRWTVRLIDRNGNMTEPERKAAPRNATPSPATAPQQAPATTPAYVTRPAKSFEDRLTAYLSDVNLYINAYSTVLQELNHIDIPKSIDANAAAFVVYKMAKDHGIEFVNSGTPDIKEDNADGPLRF